MLVGHYGASYVAGRLDPKTPLWLYFVAVQLVDIAWAVFVLVGVERLRMAPTLAGAMKIDLYYMPFTHSLVMTFVWAAAAFFVYRGLEARGVVTGSALVLALAVISHWVSDLIVHRADLPLYDNTAKVGFGLWDNAGAAFSSEMALLLGGLVFFLRSPREWRPSQRYSVLGLGIGLALLGAVLYFRPAPTTPTATVVSALIAYIVLAFIAARVAKMERHA